MAALLPNRGTQVREFSGVTVRVSERLHAGGYIVAHAHENLQLCYVLEGEVVEQSRGVAQRCGAGSLLVRPARSVHSDDVPRDARTLLVEICAATPAVVASLGDPQIVVAPAVLTAARNAYVELRTSDIARPVAMEAAALALLAAVMRSGSGRRLPGWFMEAKRRLDSGCGMSAAVLTRELGIGRTRLFAAFREYEHCTLGAYVRRAKLERALAIMRESKLSLAEVAAAAGFCDHAHMDRVFRAELGVTPSDYRRGQQNVKRSLAPAT